MYRWKNDRIWLWYCGIYFLEFIEYELLEELIEVYAIYLYFFYVSRVYPCENYS